MSVPQAEHFKNYINGSIKSLENQLLNNFMDEKGRDVSAVIRGRLYMLKDIMELDEQAGNYDKLKKELMELEAQGYKEKEQ